jgi:hypothetical protein
VFLVIGRMGEKGLILAAESKKKQGKRTGWAVDE